jgi:hypothetical protein
MDIRSWYNSKFGSTKNSVITWQRWWTFDISGRLHCGSVARMVWTELYMDFAYTFNFSFKGNVYSSLVCKLLVCCTAPWESFPQRKFGKGKLKYRVTWLPVVDRVHFLTPNVLPKKQVIAICFLYTSLQSCFNYLNVMNQSKVLFLRSPECCFC